jgi:hypothetical protein
MLSSEMVTGRTLFLLEERFYRNKDGALPQNDDF